MKSSNKSLYTDITVIDFHITKPTNVVLMQPKIFKAASKQLIKCLLEEELTS